MKPRRYQRFVFLFVLLWCTQTLLLWGQDPVELPEGVPPESEWAYSKHLVQVQEIMKNSDVAQRQAQLESFMNKLHPKSKILQYYESFFSQTIEDYKKAGKTDQANALSSKMIKMFPNSRALIAKELQAASQKQDHPKIIEYGEKLYATNPDKQITRILAESYIATNNAAKALEFSTKTIEAIGPKEGVYFAYWLADYYARQNNTEKVLEYYNMLLGSFPQSVPPGWNAEQWNNVKATAFTVRARDAYVKKDYPVAIANYVESLKYQPQNDSAYLSMGLSYWNLQRLDDATEAFAKAVVLGKDYSAKAREYLEQIYKPRNNDSLEGLDEVLAKAKAALNL
ncbi:tetratricopeptide repeat protein [Acidobacteria bacterium AH-259-D05]|nr:tetratricopeptide repeat protein [Acidobacteria bacterium AH-259-D05]